MSRPATVVDVASAAGVSRQTVSNVLNTPDIVKPSTRERVQRAIDDLQYRPHASARRLRTRRSSTLGVRLDDEVNGISGVVLDRFLHALVESASRREMRILLFTATSAADEIENFQRLTEASDVDGFVLTSTVYDDQRLPWLRTRNIPFVMFGRPWGVSEPEAAEYAWVDVDGRAGLCASTNALLDSGARRIAYVGWPSLSGQGDERRAGWADALNARGLHFPELEIITEDDTDAAAQAVQTLLAQEVPVDGFVCASDTLALGARIAVGNSVPVIGYDDTPVAQALGMSSVAQPVADVAASTLELLMGSAGRAVLPNPRGHRLLAPSVIERRGASGFLRTP